LRVSIENPGSAPITWPLDEQTLFIEWTQPRSSDWRRADAGPWRKTVVVQPGRREDLAIAAHVGPLRPQLIRAVYHRRFAGGLQEVSGTASSQYLQLTVSRR